MSETIAVKERRVSLRKHPVVDRLESHRAGALLAQVHLRDEIRVGNELFVGGRDAEPRARIRVHHPLDLVGRELEPAEYRQEVTLSDERLPAIAGSPKPGNVGTVLWLQLTFQDLQRVAPGIDPLTSERGQNGPLIGDALCAPQVLEDRADTRIRTAAGPNLRQGVIEPGEPSVPVPWDISVLVDLLHRLDDPVKHSDGYVIADMLPHVREVEEGVGWDTADDLVG